MRMPQLRRAAVLTLVAGTLAASAACFGSFNASRKVWTFNRDVSTNKFVQELVFLGMNIVPVYGIAGFLDVVVFNTVEFWTGTNPLKMASRTNLDAKRVVQTAVTEKNGIRSMEIRGFESDSLTFTTTMSVVPGRDLVVFNTVFASGRVVSRVVAVDRAGHPYLVSNNDSP